MACRSDQQVPSQAHAANEAAGREARWLLQPERPVEVELTGGAVHSYPIDLRAGTFLRADVDQLGIDVVVSLFGPGDDLLIKFDKLTGTTEPEQALWVTESAGEYRLEIAALKTAAAGRYRLRLAEPRPASEADRKRSAAEVLYAEGERLRRQPGRESKREATARLEQAVALWRQLADASRQADGMYSLGMTHLYSDERLAIAAFEEGLALLEEPPNPWQKATSLHRLGQLYRQLGDLRRAKELYHRALLWRQQAGDLTGKAMTHNNLGLTYELLGEIPKALDNYQLALSRWREIGDADEEAKTLHNLGKSYLSMGLIEEALDALQAALVIRQRLADPSSQASTLSALGQAQARLGGLDRALAAHQRALELSRVAKDLRGEAVALTGIALMHDRLGRSADALEPLTLALKIFHDLGDRDNEANTLHSSGWIHYVLGRHQRAADFYRQALELFESTQNRHGKIMTLRSMALAERRSGELALARSHIETALAGIEQIRTKPHSYSLRYSYLATKQRYYETHIDLLMDLHRQQPDAGFDAAALAASEKARARSQLDALTESGADLEHGTAPELAERERTLEKEIESLELQRLQLLDGGGSAPRLAGVERRLRDLLIEYGRVRGEIRVASPRYAALTQPRPLEAVDIRRRVVDRETLLLEYDLGEERSYLWAVTPDAIESFELPPRETIEKAARRAYKLLSSSHLTTSRVQTRLTLESLSRLLLAPVARLLGEKRLLIVADGALQYIPFCALPSPQLPELRADHLARPPETRSAVDSAPPLGEIHEIVNVASASTLAVLRDQLRGRRRATGTIAVVADPVFGLEDPRFRRPSADPIDSSGLRGSLQPAPRRYERLIFSRQEAEDILALVPADRRFAAIGFEANRAVVMGDRFADYRILHFATHGELNAAHPELSRLVLSQVDAEGRKLDGYVFAHEIYGLELAADLVVLSACETALGVEIRGEGLLGLTQGFMYAGAPSVIVSLWNVDDQATAELMARFYAQLLIDRQRPAAALRSAQISISREARWQAPYYWAGFVLQGEWR